MSALAAVRTNNGTTRMAMLETDPMHQFQVQPILPLPTVFGIDLTITNTATMMIISAC